MKRIILIFSLTLSFIYGDDPCTGEGTTKEIFVKNYPYNIVIKKYKYEDDCGYKKHTIDIFQNDKKVDTLSEYYGVDLLSDKDINNDGKVELVISGYSGGHGTDQHRIGVIEPNMKKLYSFDGYKIDLQNINHDKTFEFIQHQSVFFCISSEFCSSATALSIKLAYEFKNYNLIINQEAMNVLKTDTKMTCDTNVLIKDDSLSFSDNNCAKNNLLSIAYNIYTKDIQKLRNIYNHFNFDSNLAKEKFKHEVFGSSFSNLTSNDVAFIENKIKEL